MASSIYQQGKDLYYNAAGTSNLTKIANPTQLQDLAKTGAVEVGKAYKPYESFNVNVPEVLKAPTSANTPAVNLPAATPTPDYKSMISTVPTLDMSKFTSTVDPTLASAEATNKDLGTKLLDTVSKIGGKSAALATKQNELGVNAYQTQLNDINNQIQQLQKSSQITKLNAMGQPIAQEEINKQTADEDRRYAVKALGLSSIAQTLQGNLSTASDLAQRAIDAEYGGYESQLKYLETAINLNKDTMTSAEKKRAEELQLYIENQKTAIESAKEEKKNIYGVMTEAAKKGADSVTLNKILGAKTAADAVTLAGNYLQDASQKVIGTESTGYYERQPDGTYKQVISPIENKGATASQILTRAGVIKQNALAEGRIISDNEAMAQAQREYASLNGDANFTGSQSGPTPTNVDYGNLAVPATKLMKDMSEAELSAIQSAMQNREGYFPGRVAYRTNNPGNIKYGAFAKSMGAVDSGIKAADGGTFAKFPDYGAGKSAQMSLLKSGGYANLTFDSAMKRWSNNGYGADVIGNVTQGSIPAQDKTQNVSNSWKTGVDIVDTYIERVYKGDMKISDVPSSYQPIVQKQLNVIPKVGNSNYSKMTQNERTAFQDVLNLQSMIDGVAKTRTAATDTGPLASATNRVRGWFNLAEPNLLELKSATENLRAMIQKQISGAALSEGEVKRLLQFIPVVSDNDQVFDTKLKGLQEQYTQIMTNKANTFGFKDQSAFKDAMFGNIEMPGNGMQTSDMSNYDSDDMNKYE